MTRFSSLKHVPAETRRLLRDRFARYLPSERTTTTNPSRTVKLSDELLLQLLLNLQIEFGSDFAKARERYVAAISPDSSEPSLEELGAKGWFRVVWGRISMPREVVRTARAAAAGTTSALSAFLANRFDELFRITGAARGVADIANVVSAIDQGTLAPRDIECQTPEWVAARLWDRTFASFATLDAALRVWVDRWRQLGFPSLGNGHIWSEEATIAFHEATIAVLKSEVSLVGWTELRNEVLNQFGLVRDLPTSDFETYVPQIPVNSVDRAMWLNDRSLEQVVTGMLFNGNDIMGPVRLMLDEIEAGDHVPAPIKIADQLIALSVERPELFNFVLFRVRRNSVLIADLLLYPSTSALACLLVAEWRSPSSAWDRELTTRDDQYTKGIAFADAVSVMGEFLKQGSLDPKEVASLLDRLHMQAKPGFVDELHGDELLLTTLRAELIGQSPDLLKTMIGSLSAFTPKSGLGTSKFAAALDLIDAGRLADAVAPEALVTAYVELVIAGDYTLSANRIGVGGAVALLELAARAPSDLRRRFFHPLDIKTRLADAKAANENEHTVADTISKSIRVHIRVLSRGIIGFGQAVPEEILTALIDAVWAGALLNQKKGRFAAFSARHESGPLFQPRDRPLAADLGGALAVVDGDKRDRLLAAILETDEPMVLAQLLSFVPHSVRGRIERRINDLTPSKAGDILSLTEAQARIEELLSAGLSDAAERFMDAERNLKDIGQSRRTRHDTFAIYAATATSTRQLGCHREHRTIAKSDSGRIAVSA